MKTNYVKQKLRQGKPSFGTWLSLDNLHTARVLARAGFDWLTLDLEHSAIDWSRAAAVFALVAITLAAVGLYGVLAQTVAQRERELQEEELLEDEAPVGGRRALRRGEHVGLRRREVRVVEGARVGEEPAPRDDLGRQVVDRERRVLVDEPLHEAPERGVLVVGGAGIDRHDPPEARGVAGADLLDLGLRHLAAPAEALRHLPPGEERVPGLELLHSPGRRVEEDEVEPAARVGRGHLEHRPAVPHALDARRGDRGEHDPLLSRPELGDAPQRGPVLVEPRPELERLLDGLAPALLELGGGLAAWLERHAALARPGRNGAVVVNGNPFTLGHQHLVETASRQVDTLYLFVVREDRSVFPFAARYRLAQEATRHLPNVVPLDTGRYAVSAATFPTYFLKRLDEVAEAQIQLDVRVFGAHLAPPFGIRTRFVGEEPFDATTAAYNRAMREVLPQYGVALVEIARRGGPDGPISATRVRAALARRDFDAIGRMVPEPTLAYLRSAEGLAVAERLAHQLGAA